MPSMPGSAPPNVLTFQASGSIREEGGGGSPTPAHGLQVQQGGFGAFGMARQGQGQGHGPGQRLGIPVGTGYQGSVIGGGSVVRSEMAGMLSV